jgi:hypothetical protein
MGADRISCNPSISGKPVWPEFWKLEELEGVKASLSVTKMECTMDAKSNFRRRCYY